MATNSHPNDSEWSIAVKSVNHADFVVNIRPDESLELLAERIQAETGLTKEQQRLIYRGRLLNGEGLVQDVAGLSDGHAIHLVPRPAARSAPTAEETVSPPTSDPVEGSESNEGGGAAASMLSAFLDMGNDNRMARLRRPHHRLTTEDLQSPDPGSLESVRQGLLTLHTLTNNDTTQHFPQRTWYRGQWVDCRDTVNSWLEATIVDMATPNEVLGEGNYEYVATPPTDPRMNEPVVAATDLDGRRLLLLNDSNLRRDSPDSDVRLLLIHYNGWPHRWDEWMRSDSERLRPFRVRTRHSSNTRALPMPLSVLTEAPSTQIAENDRAAVLGEVLRMTQTVTGLLEEATRNVPVTPLAAPAEGLPWAQDEEEEDADYETAEEDSISKLETVQEDYKVEDEDEALEESETIESTSVYQPIAPVAPRPSSREMRRQLETLAPLLDRLGRTLVDVAPHVSALASTYGETTPARQTPPAVATPVDNNRNSLGGLLSLLSGPAARPESVTRGDDDTTDDGSRVVNASVVSATSNSRPQRRRQSNASSNVAVVAADAATVTTTESSSVDPDFADFASGSVNTTRGEVRGPRRNRPSTEVATSASSEGLSSRTETGSSIGSNLLGAYLAAASLASIAGGDDDDTETSPAAALGRIIRSSNGNGNGGGIDIHIHAVVAPGALGGIGMPSVPALIREVDSNEAGVHMGQTETRRGFSRLNPANRRRRQQQREEAANAATRAQVFDDDEAGIFAELYSETPDPVNPNAPPPTESPEEESPTPTSPPASPPQRYRPRGLGRFFRRNRSSQE